METKIYQYANSKRVVMEVLGKPTGWFDCISDVARRFGHSVTTITKRIEREAVINGVLIRYPNESDDLEAMEHLSPPKKHGKTVKVKSIRKVGRPKKERPEPQPKETVLNREKYNIIPYEVRNKVECITPCPYMLSPKTLVGSIRCQKCVSFRGIDRKTHEVACKRQNYE